MCKGAVVGLETTGRTIAVKVQVLICFVVPSRIYARSQSCLWMVAKLFIFHCRESAKMYFCSSVVASWFGRACSGSYPRCCLVSFTAYYGMCTDIQKCVL